MFAEIVPPYFTPIACCNNFTDRATQQHNCLDDTAEGVIIAIRHDKQRLHVKHLWGAALCRARWVVAVPAYSACLQWVAVVTVAGTKVTVLDAVVTVLAHDSIPIQDSMIKSVTLACMLSVGFKKLSKLCELQKSQHPAITGCWGRQSRTVDLKCRHHAKALQPVQ